MQINNVLIKPILTEKATNLVANNCYTFLVNSKVNKFQIQEALEKIYKVKVDFVKVIVRRGKAKRVGRKMISKRLPDEKIAYIKLISGKIDLFPKA